MITYNGENPVALRLCGPRNGSGLEAYVMLTSPRGTSAESSPLSCAGFAPNRLAQTFTWEAREL